MANENVGRLDSLLIGKETTSGTEASAYVAIPLTSAPYIKPVIEHAENESGVGRIENISSKEIVKTMSETSLEGRVGQLTFGHILTALFGDSSAGSLIETSVYKHSFTVANTNAHKSYSLVSDGNAQALTLYNMLDTLSINAEVGNVINFSGLFKGQAINTTSGETVTFVSENHFKVCGMTVKFADNIAGLTAASAIPVTSLNFEVAKNVIDITESGSCEPSSLHNQQFGITGDMELIYRDEVYKTYNTDGTQKAMRITLTGDTLIGATQYPELNFDFGLLNFDEWDRSNDNNGITTQNLGFSGMYSIADSTMLTGYLQNTQSTQY